MDKTLIIHVVSEAVVLSFVAWFLMKKINETKKELDDLKLALSAQEQHNKTCEYHINRLYSIVTGGRPQQQGQGGRPESFDHPQRPPPSFEDLANRASFQQQMQLSESQKHPPSPPQQQQQRSQPSISMFDGLINMLPSIMPLMSAGQDNASLVIRELSKKPPTVEVIDEEEDPDILEALSEPSPPTPEPLEKTT